MGKIGRLACIFMPMALTIASLICLFLVFAGNLNKNSSTLSNIYFFKADTSGFTSNPDLISGSNIDNALLAQFKTSLSAKNLKDFYTIGIWNYCSGDKNEDGSYEVTYCSPRKAAYAFDPVDVWGLNGTDSENVIPDKLNDGLKVYQKVVKVMFACYTIAFWATVGEIVLGIFAIFSRWGSFVTTIVSCASSIFVLAASATATGLYLALTGTFNTVLKAYKINGSLGGRMMAVTWLAVAFSWGAGIFWLFSTCCVSGKSKDKRTVRVEKTPYTYEQIRDPYVHAGGQESGVAGQRWTGGAYGGQKGVQLQDISKQGSAYEPFRHERV